MNFTRVARLETCTRPGDRSGQDHSTLAMQTFSTLSQIAMTTGIATSVQRQRCGTAPSYKRPGMVSHHSASQRDTA